MSHNTVFLYVEDDPFSRIVMEMLLVRGLGYKNLTIFENSHNFIERVEQLPEVPDVIFLDIHMQPYSGFEMLSMLREHPIYRDVRVVALTASVMNEEVDLLKTANFNGVIAKPIEQTVFAELLQRILNGEGVWHIS